MHEKLDVCLAAAVILAASRSGLADTSSPREFRDPPSIFLIAKSHNKNQVHYSVRTDEGCNVVGPEPLYGYWRMLEKRGEIEAMLPSEVPAYGVASAQRIEKAPQETTIRTRLNAVPDRPLVIKVTGAGGRCEASATTSIAGVDAHLRWIYVRLSWPFGVDYVLLRGFRLSDGRPVEEKLQPGRDDAP